MAEDATELQPMSELDFCARWAAVWSGFACYARAHSRLGIAEKFTDAADDVFEALEWQYEHAGRRKYRRAGVK